MKFALIDKEKIEAAPGLRGICPVCSRNTVAKCGAVRVWHWAHSPQRHCDPWWENETEWHRSWKNLFPISMQEVVHRDESTGERHIADIKTTEGIVIELQNSPISLDELKSREKFYQRLVWVVNGLPFAKNFHTLSKLPDPQSPLGKNLIIFRPPSFPLDPQHPRYRLSNRPCFLTTNHVIARENSHIVYDLGYIGSDGSHFSAHETESQIEEYYQGHHYLQWIRPRSVWYESSKDVFVDLGDDNLWQLCRFNAEHMCVKRVSKNDFLTRYRR